jgi:FixJ family two-component response regulator
MRCIGNPVRADGLELDSGRTRRLPHLLAGRGTSVDPRSAVASVPASNSCVVVIDDDAEFRASLGRLLRSVGLNPQLFASIADYRGFEPPDCPTCLVLDVRLPGRSGLDFQRDLAAANTDLPIIFMTGHGDIRMTVQAMKGGAIEFLTKPFRDQDLLDAVNLGLARDRVRREHNDALNALRTRFEVLTPRERKIMIQVAQGRRNKQIAGDMGIAEATVKVHRSNIMRKMQIASLAELYHIADRLKLVVERPPTP